GRRTVTEYTTDFLRYADRNELRLLEDQKVARYIIGLRRSLNEKMGLLIAWTIDEVYNLALEAELMEQSHQNFPSFRSYSSQNYSNDKEQSATTSSPNFGNKEISSSNDVQQCTVNSKVECALSIEAYASRIDVVSLSIETLDEYQPSLPDKLNNHADHSKPKEVKVLANKDTLVVVDKSKDEKKEIDQQDDSEKEDVDEGGDEIEKKTKEAVRAKLEATRQKKKANADKRRRYKYMVAIPNSMNIFDSFNIVDNHEYEEDETFYQDENSGSSSLEVEENVKTSEALIYGPSMRTSGSSTQSFVFDPGIHVHEFRTEASLY
ncbi:hypothetical protein L195_g018493, partial [Trifolium pratense]